MSFDISTRDTLATQRAVPKSGKRTQEPGRPVEPSSNRGRKRLARIMDAAAELFLRDGYLPTSIETVLASSGGSKATLYSYFSTKDDLFRAVIEEAVMRDVPVRLDARREPKSVLTQFLVQRYEIMSSPRHRALTRLMIAERDRFPALARKFDETTERATRSSLLTFFRDLERLGTLPPHRADDAARFFTGLVTQDWLLRSLLIADAELPAAESMRAQFAEQVDRYFGAVARS